MNNLALHYQKQGRYIEAESLYKRALEDATGLGKDHPDTLGSVNNLAFLYYAERRYGEADYFTSAGWHENECSARRSETLNTIANLAALHFEQSDWIRAAQFLRRSTAGIAERDWRVLLDASQA